MEKSFRLDIEEMKRLYLCYKQSPILSMASFMLSTQLLNNGLSFCVGGNCSKKMDMDAKQEAMVSDVWIPFARQCLDSILCYGFIVVLIEDGIPRVMQIGTYQVKVDVHPSGYDWHVTARGSPDGDELKDVYVYDLFGASPTDDGIFTSIVAKVLPRLIYLKRLRETSVLMELKRAEATVFSETKDTGNSTAAKEGVDYDFYAEASGSRVEEDLKFTRNKSNVALLQQQNDLFDTMLGRAHARKSMQTLENVVPLPMGSTMKAPPQTTGRTDLAAIHKAIEEEVCGTLGVPRSLMIADNNGGLGGNSGDSEGIHETFMHSILYYKRGIGSVLSDLYNKLFYDDIVKGVDMSKEKDVYEMKRRHSVTVFFPVTPFVSNQNLRTLYEQGVIEWKTYAKYALLNVNLPLSDMKPGGKAPPIDDLLFEKPPKEVNNAGVKRKAETQDGGEKKKKTEETKKEDTKKGETEETKKDTKKDTKDDTKKADKK